MSKNPVLTEALAQAATRTATRHRLPAPTRRRLLREELGLSQEAVASAVGVSRACVSRWGAGKRGPASRWITRYAEVLEQLAAELRTRP